MARPHRYGEGARVFVSDRPGRREPADVVSDSGIGPIEVRILATGTIELVAYRDLSIRHVAGVAPPPGAGGRDVPPLDFGTRAHPGPDYQEPRTRGWREASPRPAPAPSLALGPGPAQPKPVPPHRDDEHKAFVRTLACAVPWCKKPGPSECAHARGPRGVSQKVDDHRTFPACSSCHSELHTKATLGNLDVGATRELERDMVIATQGLRIRKLGAELVTLRRHNAALLEQRPPAGSG